MTCIDGVGCADDQAAPPLPVVLPTTLPCARGTRGGGGEGVLWVSIERVGSATLVDARLSVRHASSPVVELGYNCEVLSRGRGAVARPVRPQRTPWRQRLTSDACTHHRRFLSPGVCFRYPPLVGGPRAHPNLEYEVRVLRGKPAPPCACPSWCTRASSAAAVCERARSRRLAAWAPHGLAARVPSSAPAVANAQNDLSASRSYVVPDSGTNTGRERAASHRATEVLWLAGDTSDTHSVASAMGEARVGGPLGLSEGVIGHLQRRCVCVCVCVSGWVWGWAGMSALPLASPRACVRLFGAARARARALVWQASHVQRGRFVSWRSVRLGALVGGWGAGRGPSSPPAAARAQRREARWRGQGPAKR